MSARSELTFTVAEGDTAAALGSGDLRVLGTPRLLAWCEAATCAALDDLGPGETSVGTRVSLEHLRASPVGEQVLVTASVRSRDGRLVVLDVAVHGTEQQLLATAEVRRVVVDAERFLRRTSVAKR